MSHQELQELLGAYALDAVDPHEVAIVEAHLAECPSCQSQVAAHRETAARLGNFGAEAPAELWDRIAAGLTVAPAAPPPSNVVRLSKRRGLGAPIAALVAAAAIAAVALLGVSTLHLQSRVDALRDEVGRGGLQQAAAAAVLNPHHTTLRLTSADGRLNAEVVTVGGREAYLVGSNLTPVDSDRTYQLWGVVGGRPVSLGLLGSHPELAAFQIDPAVTRLMVTAEPAGGHPTPDAPVVVQGPA